MPRSTSHASRRTFRRLVCLLSVALAAVCHGSAFGAGAPCNTCPAAPAAACISLPRPQDQLWLVSDRSLGCAEVDARATNLQYWQHEAGRGWQAATSAAFLAGDDPAMVTHIWIHGNQISHSDAFQVGWTAYSAIARQTTEDRPLRFVIWSWPSDKIDGGPLEDVRTKAARTGTSSLHLARFIDAISSDVPVSISAYSFGARIATGALHLMAGGTLNGRTLAMTTAAKRPRFDVVLIAAALDNDWLLPGRCHGRALSMVQRMLLIINSCDKVLMRYHWIYGRRSCAEALGYTGLAGANQLGADRTKITQFDACCITGSEHDWANYWGSPAIVARILPLVFPLQTPAASELPVPQPPSPQPTAKQPSAKQPSSKELAGERRAA